MPVFNFANPFPCLDTPSQAAWYLTIALIRRTNFNQRLPTILIGIEELFADVEGITYEWLKEAADRATEFILTN